MSKPDDLPIDWFKSIQLEKLNLTKNTLKIHWLKLSFRHLFKFLDTEIIELDIELTDRILSKEAIISECVDVANYAIMIADKANKELP